MGIPKDPRNFEDVLAVRSYLQIHVSTNTSTDEPIDTAIQNNIEINAIPKTVFFFFSLLSVYFYYVCLLI